MKIHYILSVVMICLSGCVSVDKLSLLELAKAPQELPISGAIWVIDVGDYRGATKTVIDIGSGHGEKTYKGSYVAQKTSDYLKEAFEEALEESGLSISKEPVDYVMQYEFSIGYIDDFGLKSGDIRVYVHVIELETSSLLFSKVGRFSTNEDIDKRVARQIAETILFSDPD